MLMLLRQNGFGRVKDSAWLLSPGTRARAEGVFEEYRGAPEPVPQVPCAVAIMSAP